MNQQKYARKVINIIMFGSVFLLFNVFFCLSLIYFQIDWLPSFLSFLPLIKPISMIGYLGGAYSVFITAGVLMVLYLMIRNRKLILLNKGLIQNLKTLMLKVFLIAVFFFLSYHLLFTNYLMKEGFYCGSVVLAMNEEVCKGIQKPILDVMVLNLINFFYISCMFSLFLHIVFVNPSPKGVE